MIWVYAWLGITVLALIVEFCTADLISVWFAGGGLVSLILSAVNVDWPIQLIMFVVVSVILLLCFRKLVLKKFNNGTVETNANQAIGQEYRLLSPIGLNQAGTIKINDVIWSVDTLEQAGNIPENTLVKIIGVKGNKYIVEEVK